MKACALMCLLAASVARAEPDAGDPSMTASSFPPGRAPPDVLAGEPYDGRITHPSPREYLLAAPRALLMPLRLVDLGLGALGKPVLDWNERDRVAQKAQAALTSSDGKVGIRPIFDYQQSFRLSAGLQFFYARLPDDMKLTVSTAMANPQEALQQTAHLQVPLLHEKLQLDLDALYRQRDDQLYTGIGMTSTTPFARYGIRQADTYARLSGHLAKIVSFAGSVAYGIRRFDAGDQYDNDRTIDQVYCPRLGTRTCVVPGVVGVPGYQRGTQFIREKLALSLDSRLSELSSGNFVGASVAYTHGIGGDHSSYLRIDGRAGTAFELWRHRVLYLSVRASDEVQLGGTPIPFSELAVLGGPDDLRGFRLGRFRDVSLLMATIEYRWPIWMWLDASIFFDYGGVFGPRFAGVDLHTMRPDIGVGLIAHAGSSLIVRIQLGYGFGFRGGVRFVFSGPENPS